jgi:hypothetical protein
MTPTDDGKKIVYGVFDSDGYECSSLIGVFSNYDKALAFAQVKRKEASERWKELDLPFDDKRTIDITALELDIGIVG